MSVTKKIRNKSSRGYNVDEMGRLVSPALTENVLKFLRKWTDLLCDPYISLLGVYTKTPPNTTH